MLKAESARRYIEQLSALPPTKRLEAYRAIHNPAERRQVARALPPKVHSELMQEAMLQGLNPNVLEDVARRRGRKPYKVA